MHALIVEDEPMVAALIENVLRDFGCTSVDFAMTEGEAIASARQRCPDLITSDVRLAEGCGITAVQAIRSDKPIPVVFVTATDREVRERMRDAVVVPKPFMPAELVQALAAVDPRT